MLSAMCNASYAMSVCELCNVQCGPPGSLKHYAMSKVSPGPPEHYAMSSVSPGPLEHYAMSNVSPVPLEHYAMSSVSPGPLEHYAMSSYWQERSGPAPTFRQLLLTGIIYSPLSLYRNISTTFELFL